MFIPDPNFFPSRIPDPGSECIPSRIASKSLNFFNPKNGFQSLGIMIRVVHPGSGSWFFYPSRIQDVKKAPDPGSGSPQHCFLTLTWIGNEHAHPGSGMNNPDPDPQHCFLPLTWIGKTSTLSPVARRWRSSRRGARRRGPAWNGGGSPTTLQPAAVATAPPRVTSPAPSRSGRMQ